MGVVASRRKKGDRVSVWVGDARRLGAVVDVGRMVSVFFYDDKGVLTNLFTLVMAQYKLGCSYTTTLDFYSMCLTVFLGSTEVKLLCFVIS